jgi:hypothetical protein
MRFNRLIFINGCSVLIEIDYCAKKMDRFNLRIIFFSTLVQTIEYPDTYQLTTLSLPI